MESKVIQIIKDSHIVFLNSDNPRTLLCEYRMLIEDIDGGIHLVSVSQGDLDGNLTADDLWQLRRVECQHGPIKTIIASIDAWTGDEKSNLKGVVDAVLDDFLRVELIGTYQCHAVRKHYNLE